MTDQITKKKRREAGAKRAIPTKDLPDPRFNNEVVFNARPTAPIVPTRRLAGQSLTLLIAIMSFIASLTFGAVSLIDESARTWQSQISREATIQIRPEENFDADQALAQAREIALSFEGVRDAQVISLDGTVELLEPWLGTGLDVDELPIPRLVIVTIDETSPPNFQAMREAVSEAVPNASLDDHRAWIARLVSMARTMTVIGISVLVLVLAALALTVVFATRGAMATNHDVIEVLHFVGARSGYIASQFQRRFMVIGLRGGLIGGVLAIVLFLATSWWAARNLATVEGEQLAILFGNFAIGPVAYAGIAVMVLIVGLLTALTTRFTVLSSLRDIDERRSDPSYEP
ncbi:MAG: ABC transporter permease [Pseudomonadota bacterium]